MIYIIKYFIIIYIMPSILVKFKRLIFTSSCCNAADTEIVIKEHSTSVNSIDSKSNLQDNALSPKPSKS